MKKYYFISAICENNRFFQYIVKTKNPLKAYNAFSDEAKKQRIKEFNITKFYRIK